MLKGSSLLPAGVIKVRGNFQKGDLIDLINESGKTIASGLSAYDSNEAKLIAGEKSSKIKNILGYVGREALIHRDDLVIRDTNE